MQEHSVRKHHARGIENMNSRSIVYCGLLPWGPGWKQSAQQLGVWGGGVCVCVSVCVCWGGGGLRSLTANLREPKSLYLSPPESAKGLRTGGRRAARFNQPAMRLASNPDLQICNQRFRTPWFVQSSVKFRERWLLVHQEIALACSKTMECIMSLFVTFYTDGTVTIPHLRVANA